MMSMPILEVEHLAKHFGKSCAVNGISFSLGEGEILGLLGPNGAGKTTTIQMLLGVLTPSEGVIRYFGKNLTSHREKILERLNFSSTYTTLPWELTVKENLTVISHLYRIPDRKKRLEEIAQLFRLRKIWKKPIHALSAGQMTRVNLAKAFINSPKILLLDEPTASLDPEGAAYIREFLLHQRKTFNVSLILTSHNMVEVEAICDRVIFINKGSIIANDIPANLTKSIEISHVELVVGDGLKRTVVYCQDNGLPYRVNGRSLTIDIHERKIAELLRNIMEMGVLYDEISIQKPTLEDYFLQIARKDEEVGNLKVTTL